MKHSFALASYNLQSKANNFLEPVDNKEGKEKDADNNAGGSGVGSEVSVVSVIRNTFWVGSAHPVKAAPARKKNNLSSMLKECCSRSSIT